MNIDNYAGKLLDVYCKDGRIIHDAFIYGVTSAIDNYDPDGGIPREESIDFSFAKKRTCGVCLFESQIDKIIIIGDKPL